MAPCSRAAARMMLSAIGNEWRRLKAAASKARCTLEIDDTAALHRCHSPNRGLLAGLAKKHLAGCG